MIFTDSDQLRIGTGNDLKLYHDASSSYIENGTGNINIMARADNSSMVFWGDDGAGGDAEYFRLDGNSATHSGSATTALFTNFPDKSLISMGNGYDLQFKHDGTNSHLYNATGDLYISNAADNKDIILQSDDGSGGTTAYITLDGSQETINLQQNVLIGTTVDSGVYKLDVAGKQRVQSVLELEDVLTLNAISTPSDPAAGKSSIYMDSSDGAIKCKINVGGSVVTRTIASFE